MAGEKKQIAYFYRGVIRDEETEVDIDGSKTVPEKGQILSRPDGKYVVAMVMTQLDGGAVLPIYKVYLTEK